MIEDGTTVSIEYTLKLDDGSTADSNVGGQPLTYQHGSQQILPAVEREVAGMQVDESRQFVLSPEDGYGVVQTELHQQVEVDVVPEDGRHVGAQLVSEEPERQPDSRAGARGTRGPDRPRHEPPARRAESPLRGEAALDRLAPATTRAEHRGCDEPTASLARPADAQHRTILGVVVVELAAVGVVERTAQAPGETRLGGRDGDRLAPRMIRFSG